MLAAFTMDITNFLLLRLNFRNKFYAPEVTSSFFEHGE